MLDQPAASHRPRLHDGPRLDFQDHLADLEAKGLLVRIDRAINKDTELHPLVRWQFLGGVPEDKRRAFLFTHVTDAKGRRYDIPVVVGALAASPEIYAIGMGQPVDAIGEAWMRAIADPIAPVAVSAPRCQEIVLRGDDLKAPGGLASLPVPISTPGFDSAPYLTATLCVTRDPDTGIQNMGTYRAALKASDRLVVRMVAREASGAGGYLHWLKYRDRKEKMPIAIVIGCGPIGLAVILMLKAHGVRTVIASDYSPGRRALATRCGADVVVDPAQDSPYAKAKGHGHLETAPDVLGLAVSTVEKLYKLRLPWWHVWRAADTVGAATPKHPVIFECVGVPGVIEDIITGAPLFSRVVVVGVCMGADRLRPSMAINKEIDLRFVLGYTPMEFRDTLHMLADGKLDVTPLITGTVGLNGVDQAFDALGDPEAHAKILIDPKSDTTSPRPRS